MMEIKTENLPLCFTFSTHRRGEGQEARRQGLDLPSLFHALINCMMEIKTENLLSCFAFQLMVEGQEARRQGLDSLRPKFSYMR